MFNTLKSSKESCYNSKNFTTIETLNFLTKTNNYSMFKTRDLRQFKQQKMKRKLYLTVQKRRLLKSLV
jgi:hypothetical protein